MNTIISREESKEIQLNLLSTVAAICEKNGLEYYLAYGTMLGAIRHKGYIPWDDDIDIFMDRHDYEKLIILLKENKVEKPEWLDVLDNTIAGYYYPFAKIVDNRTMAKMANNLTQHGIWIDVFPIDGLPDNKLISDVFCFYCHCLRALIIAMTTDFESNKLGKKIVYKKILSIIANLIGKQNLAKSYEKTCFIFDTKESKYVASLSSAYGRKDRILKSDLYGTQKYEFEGRLFTGPVNYNEYLSNLYGDYMKLPPQDKRRIHGITAWKL